MKRTRGGESKIRKGQWDIDEGRERGSEKNKMRRANDRGGEVEDENNRIGRRIETGEQR